MKLGEDLKTWTGSARSCDWLYDTKRMKWPSFKNPRAMKLCGVVVQIMENLVVFKLDF